MHNKRRCDRRVDCVFNLVWVGVRKREIRSILNHRDLFDKSPYYAIRKRMQYRYISERNVPQKYGDVSARSWVLGPRRWLLQFPRIFFLCENLWKRLPVHCRPHRLHTKNVRGMQDSSTDGVDDDVDVAERPAYIRERQRERWAHIKQKRHHKYSR